MSYLKTKLKRVRTKYSNILMKDFGIQTSEIPTKYFCWSNENQYDRCKQGNLQPKMCPTLKHCLQTFPQTIVICNGGLSNGVTNELICETFQEFGSLEDVIMIPGKSYSFVKFMNVSNAMEAYNKVNCEIWPQIKGPVYLDFITDLKMSLLPKSYNFTHPPGLILISNFITIEEEKLILDIVGFHAEEGNHSSELKHRKVKHYGYEFKYTTNDVDIYEPIQCLPSELNFLWARLKEKVNLDFTPNQLTVNCYEPGQGIPPHVDTHSPFEDGIISLSLESSIVMDFKKENEVCNVVLPRRSLCVMLGESRYDWTHGITPRKSDIILNSEGSLTVKNREKRTSLTFRKTRTGECNCRYPRLCDSYIKKFQNISDLKSVSLKEKASTELEGNYVHEVYEKIASHFSETRHKPWPNVMNFVKSFPTGSIIVDVGCGNGKYLSCQNERFEIGCDTSTGLLKLCRERMFECFSCNCLSIPIRDNVADGCICIAVIHHLSSSDRRKKAVKEIIRILRHKGRALIYVWAKNQEKESKKSSYLKHCTKKEQKGDFEAPQVRLVSLDQDKEKLVLPVHVNRTNFSHNDLLVPWKLKSTDTDSNSGPVHLRFYHVYEDDELKDMCNELEEINVINYYYDQGNWCIHFEKK